MPEKNHDGIRSFEESPDIVNLRREIEEMELRRGSENLDEKQEVNQCADTTDQKNGVGEESLRKEEDSEIKMRHIDLDDEPRLSGKDKGEIKTAFFIRGFEDLDGD